MTTIQSTALPDQEWMRKLRRSGITTLLQLDWIMLMMQGGFVPRNMENDAKILGCTRQAVCQMKRQMERQGYLKTWLPPSSVNQSRRIVTTTKRLRNLISPP
jgi:hypothetical protein